MHIRVVIMLFLVAVIAPLNVVGEPQRTPITDSALRKYQYCGSDRDCEVATNGCCDCSSGGQMVAINKAQAKEFKAQFDCLSATCTDSTTSICDEGVVSCIEHRCKYFLSNEINGKQ